MPSLQEAQRRHAERFMKVLFFASDQYLKGEQLEALSNFDRSWEQIQHAWKWANSYFDIDPYARFYIAFCPKAGVNLFDLRLHPATLIRYIEAALAVIQAKSGENLKKENTQYLSKFKAEYLLRLGVIYKKLGQSAEALEYYYQAYIIAQSNSDKGLILMAEGVAKKNLGHYQEAIVLHNQALAIFQKSNLLIETANALMNLGIVYYHINQEKQAIEFYEQALNIFKDIHDWRGEGQVLENLGNVYHYLGEYDIALNYYQQTLALNQKIGDKFGEGISYSNIADTYKDLDKLDDADKFIEHTLKIFHDIGAHGQIAKAFHIKGLILYKRGKHTEAIEKIQNALDIYEKIKNDDMSNSMRQLLANCQAGISPINSTVYSKTTESDFVLVGIERLGQINKFADMQHLVKEQPFMKKPEFINDIETWLKSPTRSPQVRSILEERIKWLKKITHKRK